jgi:hypothetical protein
MLQQSGTALCEHRGKLVRIFLRNEMVQTCLHLPQLALERPLGPVVRLQMKAAGGVTAPRDGFEA